MRSLELATFKVPTRPQGGVPGELKLGGEMDRGRPGRYHHTTVQENLEQQQRPEDRDRHAPRLCEPAWKF